ncbi:Outer membrane protein assembly factor BamD precursor [Boseongicola aestuarii]|uniref:Outer membrane protein assembly factor BamD n=2 Tax=Boseongicola aestuarii TaxID=1470561 RepID=A0A238IUX0_9RHOB|nr:Outer membrane protein assembly factor BamD precursor [Boseongicola aestuarii]
MNLGGSKLRSFMIVTLAALTLSACGMFGGSEEERPLESFSAEELYKRAEFELESEGDPESAARFFGEVERLYPYSEWARRALVMQAFSYHRATDYEASRGSAQRFLTTYPADQDAPWAQYLLALSYYDQIDDVGRDQGLTFQALQSFREVIERYPDSEYARSSILKFDLAFDHLGGKEMEIGRYYLKRGHYIAAVNRFRVVVEDFQTTTHTPEALHRLVEAYLALGLTDEAQTAGAILGFNFQSTPWYQDSFVLLTGQGLRPDATGSNWLATIYRQVVRGEWL